MTKFKSKLVAGWKKSYVGIFLAISLLGVFATMTPAVLEGLNLMEQRGIQKGVSKANHTPSMSPDVIKYHVEEFGQGIGTGMYFSVPRFHWPAQDINDFLTAEDSYKLLHEAGQKRMDEVSTPFDPSGSFVWNHMQDLNKMWSGYRSDAYTRFGEAKIDVERTRIEKIRAEAAYKLDFDLSYASLILCGVLWYFLSGLSFAPFFIARMKREYPAMSVKTFAWGEVLTLGFFKAMLGWPAALPFYKGGDPRDAMRRSMRAVATFASILLMHAVPGMVMAYAKSQSNLQSRDEHTLVLDRLPEQPALPQGKPHRKKVQIKKVGAKPKVMLDVSVTVLPKYIGLNGAKFHDAVTQTSITATWHNGIHLGWFNSEPIAKRNVSPNFGRENDFSLGWGKTIGKNNFDVGASYVATSPQTRTRGDVVQIQGYFGHKMVIDHHQKVEPYVIIRHFSPFKGSSPRAGTFVQTGVKHSLAVGRFSLNSSAETLFDTGAFGFDHAKILRANAEFSLRPRSKLKLFGGVNFSTPLTHVTDGRKTQLVPYGGVSF